MKAFRDFNHHLQLKNHLVPFSSLSVCAKLTHFMLIQLAFYWKAAAESVDFTVGLDMLQNFFFFLGCVTATKDHFVHISIILNLLSAVPNNLCNFPKQAFQQAHLLHAVPVQVCGCVKVRGSELISPPLFLIYLIFSCTNEHKIHKFILVDCPKVSIIPSCTILQILFCPILSSRFYSTFQMNLKQVEDIFRSMQSVVTLHKQVC